MTNIRQRKFLFALLALLLIFAGCKGESPTAPAPTTGNPGGGVTPPSGASVVLTVSNANPVVDSTTVISATVTQNGTNVPNGTAVEFTTTAGTFSDSGTNQTIRTTTNGVATVTLTSSTPVTATITAVVNNVSKQTSVTFQAKPVTPVPPDLSPTITGVSPATGKPQGGDTVTITGKNFQAPVRVLFDTGNGTPKEAFVLSVTPTQIQVLSPPIDLAVNDQQKAATIIVINQAGTTSEVRLQAATPFTYQLQTLTPRVTTTSPNSGPINGGTRVTVFGDGFQAPVQVFFGAAEAQVVNVTFNQIIVISPPAPSTNEPGSGSTTGFVPLTVININSATRVTYDQGFRYTPKIQITAITPLTGSALGGTDIRIDGTGFDDPVQVTIGAIPTVAQLQVLRVSGTEILARTLPLASPCSSLSGPINVTNVEDGATATSAVNFNYVAVNPSIVSVTPSGGQTPGGLVQVTVLNPGIGTLGSGLIRFTVNDVAVVPNPATITTGTGSQTFSVPLPTTGFTFPTVACTTTVGGLPGTQLGPVNVTLGFQNVTTGCNDTVTGAVRVLPPAPNSCLTPPSPSVTAPAGGACATPPAASVAGAPATTQTTITISNANEARPLDITNVSIGGANASEFTIAPTQALQIPAGSSRTFTLTFDPATAGAKTATVTFATNSESAPSLNVCVNATANP